KPVRWGDQDPGHPAGISYPRLVDAQTGQRLDLVYRPQDEYLEWVVQRDDDGVISAIDFTCEGPEYWETIADEDPDLLLTLYGEISGHRSIDPRDLFFSRDVDAVDASGIVRQYKSGKYN